MNDEARRICVLLCALVAGAALLFSMLRPAEQERRRYLELQRVTGELGEDDSQKNW